MPRASSSQTNNPHGASDAHWRRMKAVAVKRHGPGPRADAAARRYAALLYGKGEQARREAKAPLPPETTSVAATTSSKVASEPATSASTPVTTVASSDAATSPSDADSPPSQSPGRNLRADRGARGGAMTAPRTDHGPAAAPGRLHLDSRALTIVERIAGAPDDLLLSRADLALWLGVDRKTVARWDRQGVGPPRMRAGLRRVVYRKGDALAWLRGRAATREAPR